MSHTGKAMAWLGHPATLLALAVLIVNDHVLKAAWPGPVTGKLSDFAGLMVAPPLLAALIPRLPAVAALVIAGVGFTATKATAFGAEAASAVWSVVNGPSIIRADLTDLIALAALAVSYAIWRRARPVNYSRIIVVLPIAVLGVAATSAPYYETATSATVSDAVIVTDHVTIADGGKTIKTRPQGSPPTAAVGKTLDCAGELCYRTVPDRLKVERSDNAGLTWTTAWEVSPASHALLSREYPDLGQGGFGGYLRSQALAVQQLDGDRHVVVVVANGRDGYLVRDVDGVWTRIGFGDGPPPVIRDAPLPVHLWLTDLPLHLIFLITLAICLFAMGCAVTAIRARRHLAGISTVVVVGLGLAFSALFWPAYFDKQDFIVIFALAVSIGVAGAAFGLCFAVARLDQVYRERSRGLLAAICILFGLLAAVPFMAWAGAAIIDIRHAWFASIAVALLGLAAAMWQGWRAYAPDHVWQQ